VSAAARMTAFVNEAYTDFSRKENADAMRAALANVRSELGREYDLLIAGERRKSGAKLESLNPSRPSEVVGIHQKGTEQDARDAVSAAHMYFPDWSQTSFKQRTDLLLRTATLLKERKLEFDAWLVIEAGKTWAEADADVSEAIDFCGYYARQALKLANPEPLVQLSGERDEMVYLPLGVGIIIPPWNFPLAILAGMTTAALVTGNAVVIKPSSDTPTIAAKFAEVLLAAGFPARSFSLLTGSGAAIGDVLARAEDDPAFAAQMLMPPTESELAAKRTPVDPVAIHTARLALVRAIALAHRERLARLYEQMRDPGDFSPDAKSAGQRALRNACLRYLTAADDEAAAGLADAHYRTASNMTDMIAGLAALTRMESPLRDAAFTHFHDRFRNDPLVLDKWMSLQAGSPLPETVNAVRALMKHPAFDIKNPNRVRALVGAFSANQLRFHASDGSGYRLVGEVIRTLDGMNPQVAARMAGAFESWRRYDPARQQMMRAELAAIRDLAGISPNLFEVASKMLD